MGYVSNVKTVQGYIDDWQNRALEAIGKFIDGEAALRCPVGQYYTLKTYKSGKKSGQTYKSFKGSKVGGNLRSSLRYFVNKSLKFVRNGTDVEYAIFVEKGTGIFAAKGDGRKTAWFYVDDMGVGHWTRGMKPQPFLTPAAENNVNRIRDLVKQVRFANGAG